MSLNAPWELCVFHWDFNDMPMHCCRKRALWRGLPNGL